MAKDALANDGLRQIYEATFRDHPSSISILRMRVDRCPISSGEGPTRSD